MHGIDVIQSFWGQRFREVLFADTVDTVPGEFLTTLTDEEAIFIEALWVITVSVDIELKELNGLVLKFYESETIPLTQDGHSFLTGVEVVEIEGCDLISPGA